MDRFLLVKTEARPEIWKVSSTFSTFGRVIATREVEGSSEFLGFFKNIESVISQAEEVAVRVEEIPSVEEIILCELIQAS